MKWGPSENKAEPIETNGEPNRIMKGTHWKTRENPLENNFGTQWKI